MHVGRLAVVEVANRLQSALAFGERVRPRDQQVGDVIGERRAHEVYGSHRVLRIFWHDDGRAAVNRRDCGVTLGVGYLD